MKLPAQRSTGWPSSKHNLAESGDVIVIDGVAGVSNMGGISAQTGKRQGEAGAIVSGGIRDVPHSRNVGYPVWATEVTPMTGKWRIETVEINGDVNIGGVRVSPGDIAFADDTGVRFIPRARAREVLELALKSRPVMQNWHPTAHPTCDETRRPSRGSNTLSTV
jgi:4-hydroxy-4-methyl-2-oxoglutarate aldolase